MKKDNNHSVPINNNSNQSDRRKIRTVYYKRVYYSFLTFVLILCLVQISWGAYINVAKYVVLNHKLNKLEQIHDETKLENQKLKKQIKDFSSSKGIETLARDNLKMLGKDEVLVVIKEPH